MLQCHANGRKIITFLRNARSFVILAREYLMDQWPMLQVQSKNQYVLNLVWTNREDIYDNFELEEDEMYDIDHIKEQVEL